METKTDTEILIDVNDILKSSQKVLIGIDYLDAINKTIDPDNIVDEGFI